MARAAPVSAVLLMSLAGLLGTEQVSAQVTLAVRGGPSIASAAGASADRRTGLNIGASVTFPLSGNRGIQVGGAYVQKGVTETTEQGVKVTAAIDYIEFPVLLRIGIPTAGAISPHFFVGPAVSFEADCKAEVSQGGISIAVDCNELDVDTKSIDFGAVGGVGVDISATSTVAVTLDVLYNRGIAGFDLPCCRASSKHRVWSILVGAAFPIG